MKRLLVLLSCTGLISCYALPYHTVERPPLRSVTQGIRGEVNWRRTRPVPYDTDRRYATGCRGAGPPACDNAPECVFIYAPVHQSLVYSDTVVFTVGGGFYTHPGGITQCARGTRCMNASAEFEGDLVAVAEVDEFGRFTCELTTGAYTLVVTDGCHSGFDFDDDGWMNLVRVRRGGVTDVVCTREGVTIRGHTALARSHGD